MNKKEKPKKDFLKLWGLQKNDYGTPLEELNLSKPQLTHLKAYSDLFPESEGLVFQGHPKSVAKTSTRLIKDLFDMKKISNRVTIIDVPSVLLQFSTASFEAKESAESNLISNLTNSDLVVFQEIALAQWTEAQQARLYILLQYRYAKEKPFFCTVSCDEDTFEKHVGQSNFFRISDHCTFIELKDAQ